MSKSKIQSVILVSDLTLHLALLKHKLGSNFRIVPIAAKNFSGDAIKASHSDFVIIDDSSFKEEIYRIIRAFRKFSQFSNVPILIISQTLKKKYIKKAIQAGANEFLYEPLEDEDILSRLESAKKYRQMQEKMHDTVDTISHFAKGKGSLQKKFLLDRVAIESIEKNLLNRQEISILLLEVGQPKLIDAPMQEYLLSLISKSITPSDNLINLGHGKFMLIFQKKGSKEVFLIAERLISELSLVKSASGESIRFSGGLAQSIYREYKDIASFMKDAKRALIIAKQETKPLVVFKP